MTPKGAKANDPGSVGFIQLFEAGPEAIIAWLEQSGPIPPARRNRLMALDCDALIAHVKNSWPNLESDLPKMTRPFLVFVGEADEMQNPEELREVYKNLPNVTFLTLPDLNHGQTFQRSDLILPHIKEFLARVNK